MLISIGDLANGHVQDLLQLHLAAMHAESPPESVFALDLTGLQDPSLTFFTAWDNDQLLGCGALKELDSAHAELKSMRTHPDHLGRGVGAAVLRHIINSAQGRGYHNLSLETGSGPAFEAAVRLYQRFGFEPSAPFAGYRSNPFSRFFSLPLTKWNPSLATPGAQPLRLAPSDVRAVQLVDTIRTGTATALRLLIESDSSLVASRIGETTETRTLLHVVTDYPGHVPEAAAKVAVLIAHGADVNAAFHGNHRETALHWAASANDTECINALLNAGANIEATGGVLTDGPPLDDAVIFAQWNAARLLVERGAHTALFHAAALGLPNRVMELVPEADRAELNAALWHAANNGQQRCVNQLVAVGADPDWIGFDHLTPAQAATRSGHRITFING
jgi:uncharacterized protein